MSTAPAPMRPALPVASPKTADALYEREYVGEVRAMRYAEIRSRLQGVIESVRVDEGQAVRAGDVLFAISAREAQQERLKARAVMRNATAELELARIEERNTQMLFDKDVVSSSELALSKAKTEALVAKLEEAVANENRAAIDVTYAELRAPFAGIVNRIPRKVGSMAAEHDLLTTLADTSSVHVYFRVSEREYLELSALEAAERGHEVRLKLADGSVHPDAGVIDAVESEIDRQTGTLAFRARFPNPKGTLKHGSTGKVVLALQLRNAMLVPQKSTFEVQGNVYVYALDKENRARARAITLKVRLKDAFAIASGLEPHDRFVLEGIQRLKEGTQIEIVPSS